MADGTRASVFAIRLLHRCSTLNAESTNRLRHVHGKFMTDVHRRTALHNVHKERPCRETTAGQDERCRPTALPRPTAGPMGSQFRTVNKPWNAEVVEAFCLVVPMPSPCAALAAFTHSNRLTRPCKVSPDPVMWAPSGTGQALSLNGHLCDWVSESPADHDGGHTGPAPYFCNSLHRISCLPSEWTSPPCPN